MNNKQKDILVKAGMKPTESFSNLVGKKILFNFNKEKRKLLITEAREVKTKKRSVDCVISVHSSITFNGKGISAFVIEPNGNFCLMMLSNVGNKLAHYYDEPDRNNADDFDLIAIV